ncbi:MAG: phosphoribosyltransferase family protein [Candidatus Acidiferrum sp.]
MEEQFLSLVSGRHGHFELESGHHGDLWFQLETLCQHSRKIQPFASQLAAKLLQYQVEVVCGPLVEGAFIALLVSLEIGCDFVYAERSPNTTRQGLYTVEYRLPPALRSVVKGKRVAIVNDVINAGSAVIGTFTNLQSIGVNVVAIGALLALGDTIHAFAADHHLPLELLKQMPNNLWTPSQCPLCAAGQPLEIVGTS